MIDNVTEKKFHLDCGLYYFRFDGIAEPVLTEEGALISGWKVFNNSKYFLRFQEEKMG